MNLLLILPVAENPDNVYGRRLQAAFPQLSIQWVEHHSQVDPYIAATDVVMSFSPMMADHVVRDAPRLQWIQVLGSGVDGVIDLPSLRKDVLITSGHGVQAEPVSEAVLSLMLALSRDMPRMFHNQRERRWERWQSQLLHGRTVGVLGVGAIAECLALKCKALGMKVVGISSSARAVAGFDRIYPRSELQGALAELDHLVILTPHTPETHHIVNAGVLAALRPGAFLINAARGGVVDEAALVAALRNGQLRGAALDVFEHQPLTADSDLWAVPNLIVSPHLAGINSSYPSHILPLLEKNLRLFMAADRGRMINVIRAA